MTKKLFFLLALTACAITTMNAELLRIVSPDDNALDVISYVAIANDGSIVQTRTIEDAANFTITWKKRKTPKGWVGGYRYGTLAYNDTYLSTDTTGALVLVTEQKSSEWQNCPTCSPEYQNQLKRDETRLEIVQP